MTMLIGDTLEVTGLITADAGINLGNTTLANYQEGTWTPAPAFGGVTTGITGTFVGTYTRFGRQVTAVCSLTFTARGAQPDGDSLTCGGLPFTVSAIAYGPALVLFTGFSGITQVTVHAQPTSSTTSIAFFATTGAAASNDAAVTKGTIANTATLKFTVIYFV